MVRSKLKSEQTITCPKIWLVGTRPKVPGLDFIVRVSSVGPVLCARWLRGGVKRSLRATPVISQVPDLTAFTSPRIY